MREDVPVVIAIEHTGYPRTLQEEINLRLIPYFQNGFVIVGTPALISVPSNANHVSGGVITTIVFVLEKH